jgi:hypothetical protein
MHSHTSSTHFFRSTIWSGLTMVVPGAPDHRRRPPALHDLRRALICRGGGVSLVPWPMSKGMAAMRSLSIAGLACQMRTIAHQGAAQL